MALVRFWFLVKLDQSSTLLFYCRMGWCFKLVNFYVTITVCDHILSKKIDATDGGGRWSSATIRHTIHLLRDGVGANIFQLR